MNTFTGTDNENTNNWCCGIYRKSPCGFLLEDGFDVVGLDNYNTFYDPALKKNRVEYFGHEVYECDLKDFDDLDQAFNTIKPHMVVHLAARANVRDSFGKEQIYHQDNIDATQNLIEVCKMYNVQKVVYASTSSVYGGTPIPPTGWVEDQVTGHQLNAYAYTKWVNECQFKISGLNNVGLRFFTVYFRGVDQTWHCFNSPIIS